MNKPDWALSDLKNINDKSHQINHKHKLLQIQNYNG